jgi:hypothetical protein
VLIVGCALAVCAAALASTAAPPWPAKTTRELVLALGGAPGATGAPGPIVCDRNSPAQIICSDASSGRLGALYFFRTGTCTMRVEIGGGSPAHTRNALRRSGMKAGTQRIPSAVLVPGCA